MFLFLKKLLGSSFVSRRNFNWGRHFPEKKQSNSDVIENFKIYDIHKTSLEIDSLISEVRGWSYNSTAKIFLSAIPQNTLEKSTSVVST